MKNKTNLLRIKYNFKKQSFVKYAIAIAFLLFSTQISAQLPMASNKEVGLYKNSTTCVVLDNKDAGYNVIIKNAVKEHWNTTEYEFIDYKEFEKRRNMIKYSFLVLVKGVYDKDPGGVSYDFLSLVMGGGAQEVTDMPELASIPVAYNNASSSTYGYAIPYIVQYLQRHVRVMESKRFALKLLGLKYYNFSRTFKDKVLLLPDNKMAPEASTLFKIKEAYPYKVELISFSELEERLKSEPDNTLFLLHVGPEGQEGVGKCFELVFNTEGELYYYNSRDITNEKPDGLTKKDLKKMS